MFQGNVGANILAFFGLREDSERRFQIQHFHINEFLLDVMFCISLAISHVQFLSIIKNLTNLNNPKTITDLY